MPNVVNPTTALFRTIVYDTGSDSSRETPIGLAVRAALGITLGLVVIVLLYWLSCGTGGIPEEKTNGSRILQQATLSLYLLKHHLYGMETL